MAAKAAVADARGTRSRDQKGNQFHWTDLKVVHEFTDGPYKGYGVAYVDHPDDLAALGKTMGHCAGTHFVWACEEKIWSFFTVVTLADMQPHTTLHAKQLKWVGVPHPRDLAEFPYERGINRGPKCKMCNGYGGVNSKGQAGWVDNYYGFKTCKECKGNGYLPRKTEKGAKPVPYPRSSSGGYPSFADVVAAFESVGRKYEAGKYAPLQFNSQTYEIPKNYKEPLQNFDGLFGHCVIQGKPAGVSDETWTAYSKSVQSVKAEFDKGAGAVQIVGRTFKFDSKEWYVLSFSGKGDYYGNGDGMTSYRGVMHEFFIECNKKKKKESNDK